MTGFNLIGSFLSILPAGTVSIAVIIAIILAFVEAIYHFGE